MVTIIIGSALLIYCGYHKLILKRQTVVKQNLQDDLNKAAIWQTEQHKKFSDRMFTLEKESGRQAVSSVRNNFALVERMEQMDIELAELKKNKKVRFSDGSRTLPSTPTLTHAKNVGREAQVEAATPRDTPGYVSPSTL